ncbi:substrate-binding domain-containing protein [Mycobacterium sp. AT1]|uniref:LacI family DNA-binding transcriptional regulator n=1 Tax=Mycobacterium sp. AT1 TaxID=1961706 RepID=UPI001E33453C|nr:substrate-binding domain-containing protein [Mycobacterium sp. AT1]
MGYLLAVVTMKDVALAAGVSPATVSNAFQGRAGKLSESQRLRVLEVAAELGYHGPDPAGRVLRTGVIGAIGAMFTETLSFVFDDASAVLLLKGISQIAEQADLTLSLLPFPPHTPGADAAARQQRDAHIVRSSLVDRFLAYSMPDDHPAVVTAIARRLPTVIVDAPFRQDVHYVGIHDRAAAREAAEHLIALGHRKFGIIVDRLVPDGRSGFVDAARLKSTQEAVPRERLAGYREAFTAAGIKWSSVPLLEAGGLTVPLFDVAAELLLDTHDVTAVLAVNDELGMAVLRACRRRNIAVPEQLSVVGFDDVPAAADTGLTTVHQSFVEKGRAAAQLLTDGTSAKPQRVLLPTTFVERTSTASPG